MSDLRALIYTRKSTVSDGRSTSDQARECKQWCEGQGIVVERVIRDEGISASRYGQKRRDGWAELKVMLQPGHILVCWEASRATRDLEEFVALRNLCAERRVPFAYNGRVLDLTSGDDRFVGGLDVLLAERESEMLRERFMRGKRGARLRGTQNASLGWGYRPRPRTAGQKRTEWEVDPHESARIRESVRRIIAGESLLSVLRWLRSTEGYAPASHANLRRTLTRPALAGHLVHNGDIIGKGAWEPIITEDDRQLLIASTRYDRVHPGPEPRHLCSGIVFCEACGGPLRYHNAAGRYPSYRCNKGCGSRNAEMLDHAVEKAVLRRLLNVDPNAYEENPGFAAARARVAELEADLASWRARALAEDVSADMYAQVERDRTRKIAQLLPQTVAPKKRLLTHETWADGSVREKRETVRALLRITIPQVRHLGRRARENDVNVTPI